MEIIIGVVLLALWLAMLEQYKQDKKNREWTKRQAEARAAARLQKNDDPY